MELSGSPKKMPTRRLLWCSDKLLTLDVKSPSICLTQTQNQALLQGVLTLSIGECQSETKLWISVFTVTNVPLLLVCFAKQPRHPCIFLSAYLSVHPKCMLAFPKLAKHHKAFLYQHSGPGCHAGPDLSLTIYSAKSGVLVFNKLCRINFAYDLRKPFYPIPMVCNDDL